MKNLFDLLKLVGIMVVFTLLTNQAIAQFTYPNILVNDVTTNGQELAGGKSIAVHDGVIYVVWQDERNDTPYVAFTKSISGGKTFLPSIRVSELIDTIGGVWSSMTIDNSGNIYIAWTNMKHDMSKAYIMMSKSTDGGNTFQANVKVTTTNMEIFPCIGVYGSNVYIFYADASGYPCADYYFTRSANGGTTFETPIQINDVACQSIGKFEGLNSMTVDNNGNIFLAWVDGRRAGSNGDIYFSKSTDDGLNFSANVPVHSISVPGADSIQYYPSIAAINTDTIFVAWTDRRDGPNWEDEKLILMKSTDGGATFGNEISSPNDIRHPDLVAKEGNVVYVTFNDGGRIGLSKMTGSDTVYSRFCDGYENDVKRAFIAVDDTGIVYSVWTEHRYGDKDILFSKTLPEIKGTGVLWDPYKISSLENLYWLCANDQVWDDYFLQTASIDASSTVNWFYSGFQHLGWAPIGNLSHYFDGNYDGDGHVILNLYCNRPTEDYIGLFGLIYSNSASINNLGLENINIIGQNSVGGLIGWNAYSNISNCYSTGNVNGNPNYIGGLIGGMGDEAFVEETNIQDCYSTCTVNGHNYTGGLIGINYYLTNVNNCWAGGTVTGADDVGGLVGLNRGGSVIDSSFSFGQVVGNIHSGGLVGSNFLYSTITNSYSNSNVNGNNCVGGLVGTSTDNTSIYTSYSKGNVYGYEDVGGFIGFSNPDNKVINNYSFGNVTLGSGGTQNTIGGFSGEDYGRIEYCYSIGSVFYEGNPDPTDKGFIGSNGGSYSANFFDSLASNQSTGYGAIAKNTSQMKNGSTFYNAGWDNNIWFRDDGFNDGYPYFKWQNPGGTPISGAISLNIKVFLQGAYR